jgi:hypothetical protein
MGGIRVGAASFQFLVQVQDGIGEIDALERPEDKGVDEQKKGECQKICRIVLGNVLF